MRFISVREHKNNLAKTWRSLQREGYVVLTNHGKPFAVMSATNEVRLGDTIRELERQKFRKALADIREHSVKNGPSEMSMDEINAVIAESRRDRHAKRRKHP